MSANQETPTRTEAIEKIAGMIKEIRIAMLTTVSPNSALHSRPMATQTTPFEGEALFLTAANSGKVEDIEDDAEVNLTYVDGKQTFLTMSGRAKIENDRTMIAKLWNPMFKAWFPEGEDDPNIRILRVHVEEAEYWEAPANAVLRKMKILARAATGGKTKVGEHAKVDL